jgi:hypothetical protein
MANKYTGLRIPREELTRLYDGGKTQAEIAAIYHVGQQAVQKWFKKLGIKSRVAKKRNQAGENNDNWRGDKATYAAFHYRVKAKRGQPNWCAMCERTNQTGYEWANMTGRYEDAIDYVRLCRSCHKRFDNISKNFCGKNRWTKSV